MGKIEDGMTEALIAWLEKPEREDETVRQVAEGIVDSMFGYLKRLRKEAPPTIHVGEPFKDLVTGKVQTPLWESDGVWWVVNPTSRYGYLGPIDSFQEHAAPTRAAAAKTENEDGWEAGDKLRWFRTPKTCTILATAEKLVLLCFDSDPTSPFVEPNDHMRAYYKKLGKQTNLF